MRLCNIFCGILSALLYDYFCFCTAKNKNTPKNEVFGAENRGRTDTMFPSRDFKSLASAYSAIPALKCFFILNCGRGGLCADAGMNMVHSSAYSAIPALSCEYMF